MNTFKTINPATEDVIAEYDIMPKEEVLSIAEQCDLAFRQWKVMDISTRASYLKRLAQILRVDASKILQRLESQKRFVWVKRKIATAV